MLHTQINGVAASGFGDAAGVRALQETLRKRGLTSISVTGTVDGPTAAAVYELIRDNGSRLPVLPNDVKNAIDSVKSFDSQIRSVTFGQFDSAALLRYSSSVLGMVRSLNSTLANLLQNAVDRLFSAINTAAAALNVIFLALPTGTGYTFQPNAVFQVMQPSTAGSIYTFSAKRGNVYRVAVPNPAGGGLGLMDASHHCVSGNCNGLGAPYTEVASTPTAPAAGTPVTEYEFEKQTGQLPLYKDWRFWLAVTGGVVVIGGGAVYYVRRKRSA